MFKFNSDHIFTGHIKQILNAFNLPSYKVYTAQHYKFFLDHGYESPELADGLYIKHNKILEYKNNKWGKDLDTYNYNNKYVNITKNFPITNNIYDSETHEYLGEFLRFQRDYLGIDLMPLYNCFSNRVCNNLNISIAQKVFQKSEAASQPLDLTSKDSAINMFSTPLSVDSNNTNTKYEIKTLKKQFNTKDSDYIIYMIPIKFFKEYTIALDCTKDAEICCGYYNDYLPEVPEAKYLNEAQIKFPPVDMTQHISNNTYKKLPLLRFNNSIVWQGITQKVFDDIVEDCITEARGIVQGTGNIENFRNCYKQRLLAAEANLKLFLKLPVSCETSIVVLEGDYHDFNNAKYAPEYVYKTSAVSYEEIINGVPTTTTQTIITAKQLLWTKKQNHTVTNYEAYTIDERGNLLYLPEVEDRPFKPISPLQLLLFNTKVSYPFSDRLIEYLTGNVITEWDENSDNIRRTQKVIELNNNKLSLYGAWEGKMRNILYDYMMTSNPTKNTSGIEVSHDILGYVDKDVEKFYTAWAYENCRDSDGNLLPLTERFQKIDENGDYVFDENNKPVYEWRPLYKQVNALLESSASKKKDDVHYKSELLTESKDFLITISDTGNIPLYKQKYVPITTIQNIDIYGEEE
jgi:hypothetical protein